MVANLEFGIHWFRRDLRIAGNLALEQNRKMHQGRVLGFFCFDSEFLSRPDFSHHRFAFFLSTLAALKKEMKACGGDLLVIDRPPLEAWPALLKNLKTKPQAVSFNRDYEPFARDRDQKVSLYLESSGVRVLTERDHLVLEPHEIVKDDGTFYQVYSPYGKRWFEALRSREVSARVSRKAVGLELIEKSLRDEMPEDLFCLKAASLFKSPNVLKDALQLFIDQNAKHVSIEIPEAGTRAAFLRLKKFRQSISEYKTERDFPAVDGTSRMSMYLKNGSITSSQIIAFLKLGNEPFARENGENRFLKEIAWREFYYSILWHCPRVEHEAFLLKYKNIKWQNNEVWFKKWCEGKTGYPIIDAGMRQLNTTGWMHNRVRMIVASFLTKDLLIDWRWGEKYFMQKLLDGDLAANNGGWQWAASTGCDPQPYFRIFNPYLQSKKFDPDGEYIKTYVPELKHIKGKSIHEPEDVKGYPDPIVNHSVQREKALRLYKS